VPTLAELQQMGAFGEVMTALVNQDSVVQSLASSPLRMEEVVAHAQEELRAAPTSL